MKFNLQNITFVITTFRSEQNIYNCLNSLPKEVKKIIVENSKNSELKHSLEKKYENLQCYLMLENMGFGKANNFGIHKSETDYVFILNPDVILLKNTLSNLCEILNNENFAIAAPIVSKDLNKFTFNEKKIVDVNFIKGFAMILNKNKMNNQFFDENFFLYLEEIDLCKRVKKLNGRIIIINTSVEHLGGLSHGNRDDLEMEKSRNWHWMWSTFYYYKKHNGYLYGLYLTIPKFISSLFKLIFYKIFRNDDNKEKYKMRFLGLLNSYLLRKSSYRPYKDKY